MSKRHVTKLDDMALAWIYVGNTRITWIPALPSWEYRQGSRQDYVH